ncbi:UDP-N-acetylmuramoyl-L-alanyl-D-glutamate--2,6-diaminopimelate ligase [Pseudooceanicola nanhaiensis]|uniref:UDP-N-acetylmuramoyl-L-alanyl-D-glutamate--2, 6-diaminopimelate ligase n=1 Tax=Pseudooceanicola nanhaiensis TaxID=375761 RepID=UPI001CD71A50|nr:UDP-N-acetylmuramoyl-L-alanyl-D-glutamate--2,6-diaminopimelate ligase [Pseudooceanicola nanhaiensis]MCA0920094.1 UDP-N-acetylmuramoyl-L-alanyl-D-glutamate--2,6-diaminopimelate ligase [Pseudooceanicola nanhaiensis]
MAERQGKSLAELGLRARGGANPVITGLSVDSRRVAPGHLFAALPGVQVHGAKFIAQVIEAGATVVLTDAEGYAMARELIDGNGLAVVVAEDPRQVLAYAAALWTGAQPKVMAAVTGTNGKTSVATFTRQIWMAMGLQGCNIGTTGVEGAFSAPSAHTTPEPITLHALLGRAAEAGVTHAVMEASSHGLAQRRLDGVQLMAAAFTNITQDHLDYHPDFDSYMDAKAGLFERVLPPDGAAVINIDGHGGEEMAARALSRGQRVLAVGRSPQADLRILAQRYDPASQVLRFSFEGAEHQVTLPLIGGFQAENVLVAAGLAIGCGAAPEQVFRVLPELETVRGRMQLAAARENGGTVFVDYAHTPDAIATALKALRPHVMGRLIAVIGAGGDRDRTKRPLMGQAAALNADVVFVTDDNPRSEDPAAIRAQVMGGCPGATEVADRAEAILRGVDALGPGDALLIAGKGHETGQTIGDTVFPFDDVEQASVAVSALDGGRV